VATGVAATLTAMAPTATATTIPVIP
jgi:hypothetical protein